MKPYIDLLRPKHWIKNILVFAPLAFSGRIFHSSSLLKVLEGFLCFCLISSAIYILNDIQDAESDRKHEVKRNRPIASGKVSIGSAWTMCIAIFLITIGLNILVFKNWLSFSLILIYFIANIAYSFGLKKVPLLDIAILASGFLLRLIYGASIINQEISSWLYLTVMAISFYLGLGKRRNEFAKLGENASEVRSVLKYYNKEFLDKNMYICLTLAIVFYSLWTVDPITVGRISSNALVWTVPVVMLIFMKYSLTVEKGTYADPVDVLTGDIWLIVLVLFYILSLGVVLYGRSTIHFLAVLLHI